MTGRAKTLKGVSDRIQERYGQYGVQTVKVMHKPMDEFKVKWEVLADMYVNLYVSDIVPERLVESVADTLMQRLFTDRADAPWSQEFVEWARAAHADADARARFIERIGGRRSRYAEGVRNELVRMGVTGMGTDVVLIAGDTPRYSAMFRVLGLPDLLEVRTSEADAARECADCIWERDEKFRATWGVVE